MKKRKAAIFVTLVIVMVILVGVAVKNKPQTDDNIGGDKQGKRVKVEYIKQDNIDAKISSSGKLEAVKEKKIYLDQANKVITLHKSVGDEVKKGDLVITLDQETKVKVENDIEALKKQLTADHEALSQLTGAASQSEILAAQDGISTLLDTKKQTEKNIADAKATIESNKKKLEDTNKDLVAATELFNEGLGAKKDVDQLQRSIDDINMSIEQSERNIAINTDNIKTIDAQIKTAQYKLGVLENKITDTSKRQLIAERQSSIKKTENLIEESKNTLVKASTQIVAPISGVITYLPEEEGVTVAQGAEILAIVDPSSLKVECNISPYYAADLRLGLDAEIKYTGSKTIEVAGKVSKISAVAKTEKTTNGENTFIPVEIQVAHPGNVIKPGFSVDVKVITDTRDNVCTVPILAIQEEDDLSYVYVVGEEGKLEKREVTQGLSNGLNIEVSNVKPGEMIVSSVEDFLEDGIKVSYEKIGDDK